MNISSIGNISRNTPVKRKKDVAFKGVYVDSLAELGVVKKDSFPARFQTKDALLLNEIANQYPNQDCFICRQKFSKRPYLEYRERPEDVQCFDSGILRQYKTIVEVDDKDYPCVPLIIHDESDLSYIIGVPSYISLNPSLAYTVKAGYEVHKKLLETKYKFLDATGKNESIDFGGETVMDKAYALIKDIEIAVTRYLVECSYAALSDKASAQQIYASNYPKVQGRLGLKRRLDLTTSLAKQPLPSRDNSSKIDICEMAVKEYPNVQQNLKRIQEITEYMSKVGMTLDNSEDLVIPQG